MRALLIPALFALASSQVMAQSTDPYSGTFSDEQASAAMSEGSLQLSVLVASTGLVVVASAALAISGGDVAIAASQNGELDFSDGIIANILDDTAPLLVDDAIITADPAPNLGAEPIKPGK